jgi:hypothetical protein
MKYFAFLFALILTPALLMPAMAADNNNAVCRTLVKHKPANNVVYKGGVDVKGNPVVPADVNAPQQVQVPDVIKVPLTVDLARRVAALEGQGVEMQGNMGMLEIHSDGKVMYNGQDWTAPVMTLCGQSYKLVEEVEVPAEQAAPAQAPQTPAAPSIPEKVKMDNTVNEEMMKPRDIVSKPADIEEATVKPADEPAVQRVSKPDLRMVEKPKPVEVEPTKAIPPKNDDRVIFNDPDMGEPDRIDGSAYRE